MKIDCSTRPARAASALTLPERVLNVTGARYSPVQIRSSSRIYKHGDACGNHGRGYDPAPCHRFLENQRANQCTENDPGFAERRYRRHWSACHGEDYDGIGCEHHRAARDTQPPPGPYLRQALCAVPIEGRGNNGHPGKYVHGRRIADRVSCNASAKSICDSVRPETARAIGSRDRGRRARDRNPRQALGLSYGKHETSQR
jgi:hypothetical protein